MRQIKYRIPVKGGPNFQHLQHLEECLDAFNREHLDYQIFLDRDPGRNNAPLLRSAIYPEISYPILHAHKKAQWRNALNGIHDRAMQYLEKYKPWTDEIEKKYGFTFYTQRGPIAGKGEALVEATLGEPFIVRGVNGPGESLFFKFSYRREKLANLLPEIQHKIERIHRSRSIFIEEFLEGRNALMQISLVNQGEKNFFRVNTSMEIAGEREYLVPAYGTEHFIDEAGYERIGKTYQTLLRAQPDEAFRPKRPVRPVPKLQPATHLEPPLALVLDASVILALSGTQEEPWYIDAEHIDNGKKYYGSDRNGATGLVFLEKLAAAGVTIVIPGTVRNEVTQSRYSPAAVQHFMGAVKRNGDNGSLIPNVTVMQGSVMKNEVEAIKARANHIQEIIKAYEELGETETLSLAQFIVLSEHYNATKDKAVKQILMYEKKNRGEAHAALIAQQMQSEQPAATVLLLLRDGAAQREYENAGIACLHPGTFLDVLKNTGLFTPAWFDKAPSAPGQLSVKEQGVKQNLLATLAKTANQIRENLRSSSSLANAV